MTFGIAALVPVVGITQQGAVSGVGIPWMHAALCGVAAFSAVSYLCERRRVLRNKSKKGPHAVY